MALFITSLNSGSNGNCYYIGNDQDAVLIDAGISCRETEKRMNRLGLDMSRVKAIFVSHEHSDHITGVPGISKKFRLPVYITPATFRDSHIPIAEDLLHSFTAGDCITIGSLRVTAFVKCHDAVDPHSFVITDGTTMIGVFTDIGNCCTEVVRHFATCHAVFLESNYCPDMLAKGNYPFFLKRRIDGDNGHLSNQQALDLFRSHRSSELSHLILSHLSKNNNSPAVVEKLFSAAAGNTHVVVASRYAETPVFRIENPTGRLITFAPAVKKIRKPEQLSLF